VIVHLTTSANGIEMELGAELHVADCEIAGVTQGAIYAHAPNSKVTVKNTVLRGAGYGFFAIDNVTATLDGVHAKGMANSGVISASGARVTVSNSVLTGNLHGATVVAQCGIHGPDGDRQLRSGRQHAVGIIAQTFAPGGTSFLTLKNSMVSDNQTGIWSNQWVASMVMAVLDGNAITGNNDGVFIGGSAVIQSRGNNTLEFNTNDVVGGALTPVAGQ
jgi:hypothetical protein